MKRDKTIDSFESMYNKSTSSEPLNAHSIEDFALNEKMAHFVREIIPERIIYAKGSGAYGTFTVTQDIRPYTKAQIFSKVGNRCKVFTRFSPTIGEAGSSDIERDIRGFSIKFYTEQGNWDLVGSSSPVFYIKDAKKFPALIRSQKKNPKTHLKSSALAWDFWSQNPESLHQVLILMSSRGIPYGYRYMNGYGGHTFSIINQHNERVWVKFHLKTQQGIKNFSNAEAEEIKAQNPDFSQEDLIRAIESKNFPKWTLYIQVMTDEQAMDFRWNPFDVTKVWPQEEFPLIEAGVLELNQIPEDYFTSVEQSAFSPSNVVEGISFSPDRVLQGRITTYFDAQRYRLGNSAYQIEVNKNPFTQEPSYGDSNSINPFHFERNETDSDHYTQAGTFYSKVLSTDEKEILIQNIVSSMKSISGERREEIINRQLCHFFRANIELGMKVALGLGIDIDASIMSSANGSHPKTH